MNIQILSWAQFKSFFDKEPLMTPMIAKIEDAARCGDGDWFIDMINELDHIKPTNPSYFAEFHGIILSYGLTTADFNTDSIYEGLLAYDESYATEQLNKS